MNENPDRQAMQALEWRLLALAQKDSKAFYNEVARLCVDTATPARVRKHIRYIAGALSVTEDGTLYLDDGSRK